MVGVPAAGRQGSATKPDPSPIGRDAGESTDPPTCLLVPGSGRSRLGHFERTCEPRIWRRVRSRTPTAEAATHFGGPGGWTRNDWGRFEWHSLPRRYPAPPPPTSVGDWFWSHGGAPGDGASGNVVQLSRDVDWDGDVPSRAQSPAVSGMGYRTNGVGASPRRRLAAPATPRWGNDLTGMGSDTRDQASTEGSP
jgi:hypothetical protein